MPDEDSSKEEEYRQIVRIGSYIDRKIRKYKEDHPEYADLSDEEVLELIAKDYND